jgi:hypothetical protein
MDYSGLLSQKRVLANRWLAMDYSGFQASCHNIINKVGIYNIYYVKSIATSLELLSASSDGEYNFLKGPVQ